MHPVQMNHGADALGEVANVLEQLGLKFPAVFDELQIRNPLCDELGGFAGMLREHAQSIGQEAATQTTPELLKALKCLIPHVLHYAGMQHAHPDAAKDAANARAVIAKAIGFNEEKKPSVSIEVNKFDDWGQVVGTKTVEMTREQIADVVGHTAQLIAVHRAVRRSSGDMEGIIAELDEAIYATDVMENIEVHAKPNTQKPKAASPSM